MNKKILGSALAVKRESYLVREELRAGMALSDVLEREVVRTSMTLPELMMCMPRWGKTRVMKHLRRCEQELYGTYNNRLWQQRVGNLTERELGVVTRS